MTTTVLDVVTSILDAPGLEPGSSLERRVAAVVCDVTGVAALARRQPEIVMLHAAETSLGPCSTVAGGTTLGREAAAFLNATAATWNELDEGRRGAGHPAVHVVSAAAAQAEELGTDGRTFLDAVVRGYEMQVALARTFRLRGEVHAHGTLGAPAAALAAGLLLGLDAEQCAVAVAIAANLAPAPLASACTEGTTVRHAFAATGAQIGLRSAALAAAGIRAPADSFSVPYGTLRGDSYVGWQRHEGPWSIGSGYLKTWAACAYTHTALDAALALRESGVDPATIDQVVVEVPQPGADLGAHRFEPPLAVRFSVPVLVAGVLAGHDLRDPAAVNPLPADARELAARISVVESAEHTASWPAHARATVEITLSDGTVLQEQRLDPETPADDASYVAAVAVKHDRLGTRTSQQTDALIAALLADGPVPALFAPAVAGDLPPITGAAS